MLETLCMPSMHDTLFWYDFAGYVLCYTLESMVTSEGKIILLVQAQVLILYCYFYLLQELWEYFYSSLFLFLPYC